MRARGGKAAARALGDLVAKWREEREQLAAAGAAKRERLARELAISQSELELRQAREYFTHRQRFGHELGAGPMAIMEGPRHARR